MSPGLEHAVAVGIPVNPCHKGPDYLGCISESLISETPNLDTNKPAL